MIPRRNSAGSVIDQAIEEKRPALAQLIANRVRYVYADLVARAGPKFRGIYNSREAGVFVELVRPVLKKVYDVPEITDWDHATPEEKQRWFAAERDPSYELDEELLEKRASEKAGLVLKELRMKLEGKLVELDDAKARGLSGFDFEITGTRGGHQVRIQQSMILNVSSKGKLYNQYPALIYVDGKKTSEKKYKEMLAALPLRENPADRSTHPTAVQYAFDYVNKGQSVAAAAKKTAKRLSGSPNMFLSSPTEPIHIDPKALEEALWQALVADAHQQAPKLKNGLETYVWMFEPDRKPAEVEELRRRLGLTRSNPWVHEMDDRWSSWRVADGPHAGFEFSARDEQAALDYVRSRGLGSRVQPAYELRVLANPSKGDARFYLQGKPVWELNSHSYQAMRGVHAPWIAEISPMQYAGLSKREKKWYDEKRDREWQASADVKDEWRALVQEAIACGLVDPKTLAGEARDVYWSGVVAAKKQLEGEQQVAAAVANRDMTSLAKGDVCFSIMSTQYIVVTKVSAQSVRGHSLHPAAWEVGHPDSKYQRGALEWLGNRDLEAAVREGARTTEDFKALAQSKGGTPVRANRGQRKSPKAVGEIVERFRSRHWGHEADRIIDQPDPDLPDYLVQMGVLVHIELGARRSKEHVDIDFSKEWRGPERQQAHLCFAVTKDERLYVLLTPSLEAQVRKELLAPALRGGAKYRSLTEIADIAGGRQTKWSYPDVAAVPLGHIYRLLYFTNKIEGPGFEGQGGKAIFDHQLAEEGGYFPILAADAEGRLWICGGSYSVPAGGIKN